MDKSRAKIMLQMVLLKKNQSGGDSNENNQRNPDIEVQSNYLKNLNLVEAMTQLENAQPSHTSQNVDPGMIYNTNSEHKLTKNLLSRNECIYESEVEDPFEDSGSAYEPTENSYSSSSCSEEYTSRIQKSQSSQDSTLMGSRSIPLDDNSPEFSPLTPLRQREVSLKKNVGKKRLPVKSEWKRVKAKKFLNKEKGHTQNEGDSVHACIERAKKNKTLYVPNQWYSLIQCAKVSGKPYAVKEMSQEEFLNFKINMAKFNWSKNTTGEKVSYSEIREVSVLKECPNILNYKYNFDEDSKCLILFDTSNNGRGRKPADPLKIIPPKLYNSPLPINNLKIKDLQNLCKKNLIPKEYQQFYLSLRSSSNATSEYSECDDPYLEE